MSIDEKIDQIREEMRDVKRLPATRRAIIEALLESLEANKNSLDDWRKTYLSSAIAWMALNVHAPQQPTTAWLQPCLSDLSKVCLPLTARDPHYRSLDASLRDVTYEQLLSGIESMSDHLEN